MVANHPSFIWCSSTSVRPAAFTNDTVLATILDSRHYPPPLTVMVGNDRTSGGEQLRTGSGASKPRNCRRNQLASDTRCRNLWQCGVVVDGRLSQQCRVGVTGQLDFTAGGSPSSFPISGSIECLSPYELVLNTTDVIPEPAATCLCPVSCSLRRMSGGGRRGDGGVGHWWLRVPSPAGRWVRANVWRAEVTDVKPRTGSVQHEATRKIRWKTPNRRTYSDGNSGGSTLYRRKCRARCDSRGGGRTGQTWWITARSRYEEGDAVA